MGRLRRIIDPSPGGTTQYSYDPFGNLVSTTDAVGASQSWTYNLLGFKTGASVPVIDAGNWVYRLDSLGELGSMTNAKSQTITYTYDALSRPLTRTEPEGTTRWIWDSAAGKGIGQLASVSSPGYGETYVYDSLGRPQTISYAEDRTYQVDFAYNTQGLVDTLTYPVSNANYRLELKYDYSYGDLTATRDANGSTVFWQLNSVDAFGHLIDEQTANGLRVLTSFDPSTGRMESRQSGTGGSTTNAQNLAYTWDTSGDLSQRQDLNQSLTEVFHYDALHRVTDSTLNGSPNFAVSLDAAGNILSKTGMSSYTYEPTYKRALQTAGGSSYSYDSNGNVTSGGGATINWQSYNLPSLISKGGLSSQFFYDANRQRWKQVATFADGTQTTIYVAGLMEKIRGPAGTGYRYYIPAGSSTVIYTRWCDGTTNTFYVTQDHLGSSSAVTCGPDVNGCANGAIFVEESFDAYGARRGSGWSGAPTQTELTRFAQTTRHGYTGHEMLDNIGLIHMGGRVYDPMLGRFLSADPLMGGESQGLNRYSYVSNNPLAFTDPSGFECRGSDGQHHACNTDDKTQTSAFYDWRNGPRASNSVVSCYGNCGGPLAGYFNSPFVKTSRILVQPSSEHIGALADSPMGEVDRTVEVDEVFYGRISPETHLGTFNPVTGEFHSSFNPDYSLSPEFGARIFNDFAGFGARVQAQWNAGVRLMQHTTAVAAGGELAATAIGAAGVAVVAAEGAVAVGEDVLALPGQQGLRAEQRRVSGGPKFRDLH
jgi:RHS repeat-associated protein